MKQISIVRKKEVIIWGAIIVIMIGCWIGMRLWQKEGSSVVISIEDREVETLPLKKNQIVQIEGENEQWVKLQIKDGTADVIEASCPDQICVNHYAISKEGEPIVCLPAKVIIRIKEAAG